MLTIQCINMQLKFEGHLCVTLLNSRVDLMPVRKEAFEMLTIQCINMQLKCEGHLCVSLLNSRVDLMPVRKEAFENIDGKRRKHWKLEFSSLPQYFLSSS